MDNLLKLSISPAVRINLVTNFGILSSADCWIDFRRKAVDHRPIGFSLGWFYASRHHPWDNQSNVLGKENQRKFIDAYPTVSRSLGLCFEFTATQEDLRE